MSKQLYGNSGKLFRFIIRLDRIRLPLWLLSLSLITWIVASSFTGLYATEQDRQAIAETMLNPAMTAMLGIGYGLDNYTFGAMMAHQMLLFTAIAVGIMSIMIVTRHTRGDEEDGRIELIRSLPAGRLSSLHATVLVVTAANLVLAIVTGIGLYALGVESIDLHGSLLYGAALGATGIIFAAITALFAQLSESSRGTIGWSMAVLLLAYLIRAIGDVGNEAVSWLSPLGWILRTEVYVNNNWWPVVLTLVAAGVIFVLAYFLSAIRDLDAGFLPSKPGRRHASALLLSPLGLGLRLQRTGLIAWVVGMYVLGASYGSVLGDLDAFFANNEMMQDMLTPVEGFSLTELFVTMLMSIVSMICTIPALMAILKLYGEEKRNRTEHLMSRAVSRIRLLGSFTFISVAVGFVMLSAAAIGLGTVAMSVMDDPIAIGTFYSAAMAYLPAMWIMTGFAVLLIGLVPRWTGLAWLYLTYSFLVVYLGGLLQFPEWMGRLSPFGHISKLPVEDMDFAKASLLTLLALILLVAGFAAYRRRDLHG